ncbi:MAG: hypothetical protein GXY19_14155 [Phycisphaerae bacterium]|nr:hypothetical protein [Phycisphaerae bacterium]
MRDIYKNPILYYVLAPILVGLWPLLVWGMYLPRAQKAWDEDEKLYAEAKNTILSIIERDPERVKLAQDTKSLGKFAYAEAVDRVVNLCGIRSSQYTLSSGQVVTTGKKESQQARVGLVGVSIVQAARFLSTIQSMWVNLNCERLKLTKKPGVPDQWDLDMTFQYDY